LAALQGFWHFLFNANWLTFIWTIFLWIFSGMGITAGAHRLWAHRVNLKENLNFNYIPF